MRTASGRKRTMQTAASVALPILGALVDRAAKRTGSRMVAYDDVGRHIGESGSWVRKFLGRQSVRLDADTFLAIQSYYNAECERWEAEAALQKARFFALQGGNNAMDKVTLQRLDVDASGSTRGTGRCSSVVARVVDEDRQ